MRRLRMSREEREEHIIDAAKSLFIEKGYQGATTSELAKRANISEVTLFRYFSSKSELFMTAIGPILTETIEEVLRDNELSVKELLEEFIRDRLEFIIRNRDLVKLMLVESEMHHELSDQVKVIDNILTMLKELINRLEIDDNKKMMMLRMIIGTLISFIFVPRNEEESIESYVADFLDHIDKFIVTSNV